MLGLLVAELTEKTGPEKLTTSKTTSTRLLSKILYEWDILQNVLSLKNYWYFNCLGYKKDHLLGIFFLLSQDGISEDSLDLNSYYAVGYDSPFRLFWRTNEVWIKKKEESQQEVEQEPVKDTDE